MKRSQWLVFLAALIFLSACGESAASYNNRGNDAFESKRYDEALENYTSAKREDPDLPQPYYNSGNTYHRQGDLKSAMTQIRQSLRTAEGELAQQGQYNLGNTFFQAEQWQAAIEAYQEALRLNPDDIDAKHNLELALQNLQQQQQQQQQQQPNQGGGQGQPQQQPQQGQQGDQPQPGGGEQPDESEQPGGSSQDQPQQSGQGGLSPEEAEQLLDALGQNGQTLQERLNQTFGSGGSPKPPPAQDW